jgi:hypothetical protein
MKSPAQIAASGVVLGLIGAAGQMWLIRFGALASAPLRSMLSLCIAIVIGVIAGTRAPEAALKVAALMGVIAGAILTSVGLGALLMNPSLIGQNPFASAETFFVFVSSVMSGTIVVSWLVAGVAVLVAWPISLTQSADDAA